MFDTDQNPVSDFRSLAVFAGSRMGSTPAFEAAAHRLGTMMAERGMGLVYGGGNIGLMGVVARAVLKGGGSVTGVIPEFLQTLEVGNPGVTELIVVDTMHTRKARMFDLADAFVVLPGGLGTLDEVIEIATWKQLQLHAKPIVIVDVDGYWAALRNLAASVIAGGFAHAGIKELFTVVDSAEGVFDAIAAAPPPNPEVLTSHL